MMESRYNKGISVNKLLSLHKCGSDTKPKFRIIFGSTSEWSAILFVPLNIYAKHYLESKQN